MAAGAVIAAAAPTMVIGIESANACRYRRAFMICPVCKRVYFRLALNEPTGVCEPAEAMRSALRARARPRGARPGLVARAGPPSPDRGFDAGRTPHDLVLYG